jgi:hypothetical protein
MLSDVELQRGMAIIYQDWDYRDRTVRLWHAHGDLETVVSSDGSGGADGASCAKDPIGPVLPWPSAMGPCLVRLAFGVGQTPGLRDYPAGLVAPWLPLRAYYIGLLSDMSSYNARVLNNPVFVDGGVLGTDASAFVRNFYGTPCIPVSSAFFTNTGTPMLFQLPLPPLNKEYYDLVATVRERLNEASHMSDIMRGHQFTQGTSATEAQAIMEVQSQWLKTQQSIFRDAVEQVWRVWATLKGLAGHLSLTVPDQHTLDPVVKLQKADRAIQLMSLDPKGQVIDPAQAIKEIAELVGLSDKVIRKVPMPMPGMMPGMAPPPVQGVPNA